MTSEYPKERRLRTLAELYEEMTAWARKNYDPAVVQRKIETIDPRSKLFIVGEGYAQNQVRLTGISWFNGEGKLGPSGKNLECILRCLGYTLYPPVPIQLEQGLVQARAKGLKTVYTTDIFPCYPPGGGAPTPAMIADALCHRFLIRESEILQPKVILLLGEHSHSAFSTYLLQKAQDNISKAFALLSPSSQLLEYQGALVIPFLHPSPASPTFSRWFSRSRDQLLEQPQIQTISAALTG